MNTPVSWVYQLPKTALVETTKMLGVNSEGNLDQLRDRANGGRTLHQPGNPPVSTNRHTDGQNPEMGWTLRRRKGGR